MRPTAFVVVALMLAGCSDASDVKTPGPPTTITDPRDFSYLNATPGSHFHDYWDGKDEVELLNMTGPKGCATYGGPEAKLTIFQPPEGHFVPQGTGKMEARLSWVETASPAGLPPVPNVSQSSYTSMELWVKTAQDSALHKLQTVENGQTFSFNITNRDADPPHYTISLWSFESVAVNEAGDSTSFCGYFQLHVIAHRTLPLVTYPPHPDPWGGRDNITLIDDREVVVAHVATAGMYNCLGSCANTTYQSEPGVIVPFNATAVRVVLTLDPTSLPIDLVVMYHGADTLVFQKAPVQSASGSTTIYEIDVKPGMGDSPYANQTIWQFRVQTSTSDDAGAWRGDYTIDAYARR